MVSRDADLSPEMRRALAALSLLSGKWHAPVLAVLLDRERAGFNELLTALPGLSGKVLTDTLDDLQDAGLVTRRVTSESPLRVEYASTDAGADMQAMFDELAEWAATHHETPTVLVADSDRRITEMYAGWLADRYTVVRAHDSEELQAAFTGGVAVAVVARRLTGLDPASIAEIVPEACRIILLADDRPAVDVLDIDCDDVCSTPLVGEQLRQAVERQFTRRGESSEQREQNALKAKLAALEQTHAPETLEASDRYTRARDRLER